MAGELIGRPLVLGRRQIASKDHVVTEGAALLRLRFAGGAPGPSSKRATSPSRTAAKASMHSVTCTIAVRLAAIDARSRPDARARRQPVQERSTLLDPDARRPGDRTTSTTRTSASGYSPQPFSPRTRARTPSRSWSRGATAAGVRCSAARAAVPSRPSVHSRLHRAPISAPAMRSVRPSAPPSTRTPWIDGQRAEQPATLSQVYAALAGTLARPTPPRRRPCRCRRAPARGRPSHEGHAVFRLGDVKAADELPGVQSAPRAFDPCPRPPCRGATAARYRQPPRTRWRVGAADAAVCVPFPAPAPRCSVPPRRRYRGERLHVGLPSGTASTIQPALVDELEASCGGLPWA